MNELLTTIRWAPEVRAALESAPSVFIPRTRAELIDRALGPDNGPTFDVVYPVEGDGVVTEATVVRCRNGIAVNYPEDYMRRRDPDCMRISDDLPTDKPRYRDVFGSEFAPVRQQTLDWLARQDLIVVPFRAGGPQFGYLSAAIIPANAAFFAAALVDLQGFVDLASVEPFDPRAIIYVAPPFRHTTFAGRQVVVHNRSTTLHEVFAYNLYPGPSAKKGVFSVLLDIGQQEGWITAHASAVKVTTPYDNETVIMHEGASGGGKSEMTGHIHRQDDGRILLGVNVVTEEPYVINLGETSALSPVIDDMALCHATLQNDSGKLVVADAEDGWFVRTDSLTEYGSDPALEKVCIHPEEPLVFFNVEAVPGATALVWDHVPDSNGKPCSNPRVCVPRRTIKDIVPADEAQEVDVRTFGVRMPPATRMKPSYGIMGMMHIIPPSLGWLWRLIAPRGHKNPSIGESADVVRAENAMISEGVGSYWPFSTGQKVASANLLLQQIVATPRTRYVLVPNQHIGAYKIGFSGEWLVREYLARRGGANFKPSQLVPARCSLFGYALTEMKIDGQLVRPTFLQPENQSQVGVEAYDIGAGILTGFFKSELEKFLTPELDPLGREIIECCLRDGTVADYVDLTPIKK